MHHLAYIDPGTGSLFVQASLGMVLAGGFVLRNSVRRLRDKLFSRSSTTEKQ
jgi:hypothetical protein